MLATMARLAILAALLAPGWAGYHRDMEKSCYRFPLNAGQTSCDPDYSVCIPDCVEKDGIWCKVPVFHGGSCRCKCAYEAVTGPDGSITCQAIQGLSQDQASLQAAERRQKKTGVCDDDEDMPEQPGLAAGNTSAASAALGAAAEAGPNVSADIPDGVTEEVVKEAASQEEAGAAADAAAEAYLSAHVAVKQGLQDEADAEEMADLHAAKDAAFERAVAAERAYLQAAGRSGWKKAAERDSAERAAWEEFWAAEKVAWKSDADFAQKAQAQVQAAEKQYTEVGLRALISNRAAFEESVDAAALKDVIETEEAHLEAFTDLTAAQIASLEANLTALQNPDDKDAAAAAAQRAAAFFAAYEVAEEKRQAFDSAQEAVDGLIQQAKTTAKIGKLEKQDGACVCTTDFAPVCGGDGKTYDNACKADCNAVTVLAKGPCPEATTSEADAESTPGEEVVEDQEEDCVCPTISTPVCGVDGKIYHNECIAGCMKVEVARTGECGAKKKTEKVQAPAGVPFQDVEAESTTTPNSSLNEWGDLASEEDTTTSEAERPATQTTREAAGMDPTSEAATTSALVATVTEEPEATKAPPKACCKAMTKECLACSEGVSVKDFCLKNKGRYQCPGSSTKAPPDEKSVLTTTVAPKSERLSPSTSAEPEPKVTKAPAKSCCKAMTKDCLACSRGISVKEFCSMYEGEYQCPKAAPADTTTVSEGKAADEKSSDRNALDDRVQTEAKPRSALDDAQAGTSGRCCTDMEDKRCVACVNLISEKELCSMFPAKYGCGGSLASKAVSLVDARSGISPAGFGNGRVGPAMLYAVLGVALRAASLSVAALAYLRSARGFRRLPAAAGSPRALAAEAQGLIMHISSEGESSSEV